MCLLPSLEVHLALCTSSSSRCLCFLRRSLRSVRSEESAFFRLFSDFEAASPLFDEWDLEPDFEELDDFVDRFFFSPSFLTFGSTAVCSDAGRQSAKEEVERRACCGRHTGNAAAVSTAADGGPGPGIGCGTVGTTQPFDSTAASLLGKIEGCATVLPLSRTSQTFMDCSVLGMVADAGEATSAVWGTGRSSADGIVCETASFPCALSMSHSEA